MKIRNGFVSNSSSSSFIVFADKIERPSDLTAEDLKNNNIRIIGKDLCEGTDFFEIKNKQMLEYAQKNEYLRRCEWLKVIDMVCEEDNDGFGTVPAEAAGKLATSIEVDYHVSDDLEQMKMRYDDLY